MESAGVNGNSRRRRVRDAHALPRRWVAAYLMLLAVVVAGGLLFSQYMRDGVRQRAANEIAAIADLKAGQIRAWLDERLADARAAVESPFFSARARELLAHPEDAALREDLLAWMRSRMDNYGYRSVFLLDADAEPALSENPGGDPLGEYAQGVARGALESGDVVLSDLHRGEGDGCIHMDLVAPIPSPQGGRPAGALLLRADPYHLFYPLIQSWPTPSETAETLLVRREGKEVLFLNQLRHRAGTALELRFPLGEEDLPAARAARGEEGLMEGTDYRGVKVLAVGHSVPGTDWYLVAKVDESEVYSPMTARLWLAVSLVVLLVLALGAAFALAWSRRQARLYRRQRDLEAERAALARHYEYLTRYANDIIVLMDDNWNIVEANERAAQAYGYSREELIGMPTMNLRSPAERAHFARTVRGLDLSNGTILETEHMRKDGSVFPVEISARVIEVDGKRYYQGIVRDFTERKRAEAELRASEERYRQLFRRTPIGVFHYDLDLTITDCNDRFVEILRSSRERLVGLDINTLRDRSVLPAIRAAVAGIEGLYEGPYSATTSEAHIHISMRTAPLRDAAGGIISGVGIVEDITERKRMEAELRASEERYRQLFRRTPIGVFHYDLDLTITDCNDRFVEILRSSRERLVGLHMRGLRDQPILPALRDALAGKRGFYEGPYASTISGKELWILLYTAPVRDEAGEVTGAIATLEDISERRALQEKLAERELFLRRLTDNMLDLISQVDVDGNFVYLSPSNEKVLGYREGELLGHNVMELVHPDDLPAVAEAYARSNRELVPGTAEFRAKRADGSYVWVESVGNPLFDEAGKLIGAIFVTRDISERKLAGEELRLSEARFRELFENMGSGVAVYEARDEGDDFVITGFNRAAERIESISRDKVMGRSVLEAFPGLKDFGLFEVFQRVWRTGKPERFPAALYRDERISGWREYYVSRLPSGEVVAIYEDVTERKRAEWRLERLNRCFLELGTDPLGNISLIVDSGQEILEADAMHYSRME